MDKKYDAIVIGAGQAGPPLAKKLAHNGMKVALIERKLLGGTCVNTGCVPSKAFIANAEVAHLAKRSADFGVLTESVTIDMKKVHNRVAEIVTKVRTGLEKYLKDTANLDIFHQHAKFENSHTIRVGNELLTAEKIFIDVGARAFIPAIQGLENVKYLTNSTMMDIDFLPEHLIIIGGSYIGLEFAQMYRRFGAKVTVIEKSTRLIAKEDEDISQTVQEILEKEDIQIFLNIESFSVENRDEKIAVKLKDKTGEKEIIGSHLLLAIGRKPNTDDLGLEKTDIAMDERGFIKVNDQLETNIPGIWALGECNGKGAFTHTSYNDFEIVAANLLTQEQRRVSDRILAYNLYIDPPLGRIGMTENEVRKSGKKALIATMPMKDVKRAVIKGNTQGFMKVLVDAETKQILGAAILGVSGDEVIHCLLDVMYAKAPYTVITHAVHIHPTISELVPTLLEKLTELK